jgi:DNA replication and repair protein RecF
MYLKTITLKNFRNYDQKTFSFSSKTNLVFGPNGAGKSNLLEAIHLLSYGQSFRAQRITQLIRWGQPLASVQALLQKEDQAFNLEIQLSYGQILGKTIPKRRLLLNEVLKTRKDYLGVLKSVVFQPEDIRLITGSPSRRRDFLDQVLSQLNWEYARASSQYRRALAHRNKLLDLVRDRQARPEELLFWDQSLLKNADIILRFRHQFVDFANHFFQNQNFKELSYLNLCYLPKPISAKLLKESLPKDLHFGSTSLGPHRDDFYIEDSRIPQDLKDLSAWGSRGQQRLGVLGLRLAQIHFLKEETDQKPLLLLDDIFSELDPNHQKIVISLINSHQTIITSADPDIKNTISVHRLLPLSA